MTTKDRAMAIIENVLGEAGHAPIGRVMAAMERAGFKVRGISEFEAECKALGFYATEGFVWNEAADKGVAKIALWSIGMDEEHCPHPQQCESMGCSLDCLEISDMTAH